MTAIKEKIFDLLYDIKNERNSITINDGLKIILKEIESQAKQVKECEKLVILLNNYNDLLGEELNSCVPVAHIHGWRSDNVSKGEKLRESIKKQIEALNQQRNDTQRTK